MVVVNGNMVAKIYDPLYYPALDDYTGERADVVELADRDYSREAAVYDELEDLWGTMVPQYHGSWTFNLPTNTALGIRPVRLILIELIDGVCMRDLNPKKLTEKQRSNIMVKVIEAETIITYRGGVRHRDLAPRNVICSGRNFDSPELRVAIIDFNISIIFRIVGGGPPREGDLPPSPISRWTGGSNEFTIPGWMSRNRKDHCEWLWKQFSGSQLYLPATRAELLEYLQPIPH